MARRGYPWVAAGLKVAGEGPSRTHGSVNLLPALGIGNACWDSGLLEGDVAAATGPAGMAAVAVVRSAVAAASSDGNRFAEGHPDGGLGEWDLVKTPLLGLVDASLQHH
jgi:hypothetical protein